MTKVPLGFIPDTLLVPLDQILPSRKTPTGLITSVKFKQIRSSIDDVGLIEPLPGQVARQQISRPLHQTAAARGIGTVQGHRRDDFTGSVSEILPCGRS